MAKRIKIVLDYDIEQVVYLKTDMEQQEGLVTEIRLLPGGNAIYTLACADIESDHYAFEISDTKFLFKTETDD